MNILYLHGLESKLSDSKRKILEAYGRVYAPDIDYKTARVQPKEILKMFPDVEFNVVIGSSMGAFNGFFIARAIGRPALLFNPPLAKYKFPALDFEPQYTRGLCVCHFVLGGQDTVVDPGEALGHIGRFCETHEMYLHIRPEMGHRVPIEVLEEEMDALMQSICT